MSRSITDSFIIGNDDDDDDQDYELEMNSISQSFPNSNRFDKIDEIFESDGIDKESFKNLNKIETEFPSSNPVKIRSNFPNHDKDLEFLFE